MNNSISLSYKNEPISLEMLGVWQRDSSRFQRLPLISTLFRAGVTNLPQNLQEVTLSPMKQATLEFRSGDNKKKELLYPNPAPEVRVNQNITQAWVRNEAKESWDLYDVHRYEAVVDVQTGEIYIDCRKRRIWGKHLAGVLITIPYYIYRSLKEVAQIFKPLSQENPSRQIGHHLWRAIKMPLYALAIEAILILGLLGALVSPNILYTTRRWVGILQRSECGIDEYGYLPEGPLPCFSPIDSLSNDSNFLTEVLKGQGCAEVANQVGYFRSEGGAGLFTPSLRPDESYDSLSSKERAPRTRDLRLFPIPCSKDKDTRNIKTWSIYQIDAFEMPEHS